MSKILVFSVIFFSIRGEAQIAQPPLDFNQVDWPGVMARLDDAQLSFATFQVVTAQTMQFQRDNHQEAESQNYLNMAALKEAQVLFPGCPDKILALGSSVMGNVSYWNNAKSFALLDFYLRRSAALTEAVSYSRDRRPLEVRRLADSQAHAGVASLHERPDLDLSNQDIRMFANRVQSLLTVGDARCFLGTGETPANPKAMLRARAMHDLAQQVAAALDRAASGPDPLRPPALMAPPPPYFPSTPVNVIR